MDAYPGNDIWLDLNTLANGDQTVIAKAASELVNTRGHISLRALEQKILEQADTVLHATIMAAESFARAANYNKKLIDLPHLDTIYAMAQKDISLPQKVFNMAAMLIKEKVSVEDSIRQSIDHQQSIPRCH